MKLPNSEKAFVDVTKLLREVRINSMDGIKNLGVVALLADKPEVGLKRGDVGTVVEVFEKMIKKELASRRKR